jgi:hypothetical protein
VNALAICLRVFVVLSALLGLVVPQTVTCGSVVCGSGSSACVPVQVSRNGSSYTQVLWVNTTTGLSYLPLPQKTVQPFPTVAQVSAGLVAPNSAVYTKQATAQHVYLIAYSCVHLVISATGATAIDTLDATFAVTNDQTAGTYSAGNTAPPGSAYATPYACTGTTSVPALLAGTIPTAGVANVNLSGTAFAVSGSAAVCNGAQSCTCSGSPTPVCSVFSASTYQGAGVIKYSLAGQAVVLIADGNCGSWIPPNGLVPLDGVVMSTAPACGGVPCGLAGSSCSTVQARLGRGRGGGVAWSRVSSPQPPLLFIFTSSHHPSAVTPPGCPRKCHIQPDALGRRHGPDLPPTGSADC